MLHQLQNLLTTAMNEQILNTAICTGGKENNLC